MTNVKKTVLVFCTLASLGLGACANTLHGAGKDVENAGESVQDAVPAKR